MRKLPRIDLKPWFLTIEDVEREYTLPLHRSNLFEAEQPLEIDVGCGRGLFLVNAAQQHPNTNFLGIELDYKEGRRAATRLHKRRLPNVRIVGGDAQTVFRRLLAPASIAAIHVYFPDPWWKHRHRRRRVFNDRFVSACADLLVPGGLLHSWTDVEEYFGVIRSLMDHHPAFETLPPPEERPPEHDLDYHTSFERKKRKLGLPIFRGCWRRREATLVPAATREE